MEGFKKNEILVVVAISLSALTSMAQVTLFSPSIAFVQKQFSVGTELTHLLISMSTLFYAFTALTLGAFENYFNTRKMFLVGLITFNAGSFLCYMADDYWMLFLGRAIQGIGAAGPSLAGTAIIAQSFNLVKQRAAYGIIAGIINVGFLFAPALGVYISVYFEWRDDFLILFFLGLFSLLLAYKFLPSKQETLKSRIKWHDLFEGYERVILDMHTVRYAAIVVLMTAGSRLFFITAPILFLKMFTDEKVQFSVYETIISVILLFLSFWCGATFKKFGTRLCLKVSALFGGVFFVGFISVLIFELNQLWFYFFLMLCYALCRLYPGYTFSTLAYNKIPGSCTRVKALMSFSNSALDALLFQFLGFFSKASFLPLGCLMLILMICSLILMFMAMSEKDFYKNWKQD